MLEKWSKMMNQIFMNKGALVVEVLMKKKNSRNNFVNTINLCAMIFAQIYSNSQFTRKTILQ